MSTEAATPIMRVAPAPTDRPNSAPIAARTSCHASEAGPAAATKAADPAHEPPRVGSSGIQRLSAQPTQRSSPTFKALSTAET